MDKEEGILLSENHGLNPSIDTCIFCGKDMGIILFGKLEDDKEAPKKVCSGNLCNDCLKRLEEEKKRLYIDIETGKCAEIPDECLQQEYLDKIKEQRYFLLTKEQFNLLENGNSEKENSN